MEGEFKKSNKSLWTPKLGRHVLEHMPGHVRKHVPDRHVPEYVLKHVPKHVLRHMLDKHVLEHVLNRMAHAVLMT